MRPDTYEMTFTGRADKRLYVRLASPSLSLVKIMRITGPDTRFLAFQVPEQAAGLRLP